MINSLKKALVAMTESKINGRFEDIDLSKIIKLTEMRLNPEKLEDGPYNAIPLINADLFIPIDEWLEKHKDNK